MNQIVKRGRKGDMGNIYKLKHKIIYWTTESFSRNRKK
jgi:hypothetical protein